MGNMGTWSWSGILLIIALFLLLFGFILSQINIENPLTGQETSIMNWIIGVVVDGLTPW